MNSRVWLLGAIAMVVSGFLARPGTTAKPGRPYLVAVGVGEFSDPAIDPRPTADHDAVALRDLLADVPSIDVIFVAETDEGSPVRRGADWSLPGPSSAGLRCAKPAIPSPTGQ
jgi:hypothetical protein